MIRDPETHRMLLDTVTRFVREKLIPAENEVAETDTIPARVTAVSPKSGASSVQVLVATSGRRGPSGRAFVGR